MKRTFHIKDFYNNHYFLLLLSELLDNRKRVVRLDYADLY